MGDFAKRGGQSTSEVFTVTLSDPNFAVSNCFELKIKKSFFYP